MNTLDPTEFAAMFGGPLDPQTIADIENDKYDWRFKFCDRRENNKAILELWKRIDHREFSIVGENNERWQKGWSENFEDFKKTNNVKSLEPKYLRAAKYLRLGGNFIEPWDPMFEANWYKVFRGWFARRHLARYDAIYEFGCGSGHNVAFLAEEFRDKVIVGLDWSEASVKILDLLRCGLYPNVIGQRFDFFQPSDINVLPNSCLLTVGAMEQTGREWGPFLNFLRRSDFQMCFHIEPMLEWYDPTNLVDWTAIRIHETRGFWKGFIDEISPLGGHRTAFGSLLLEGYSQLRWSPQIELTEQARVDALEGAP